MKSSGSDNMKIQMASFDRCITIEVNDHEKYNKIFEWFRKQDDSND